MQNDRMLGSRMADAPLARWEQDKPKRSGPIEDHDYMMDDAEYAENYASVQGEECEA